MLYNLEDLIPDSMLAQADILADNLRILQLILFLCQSGKEAIENFVANKLDCFDAQVSENLCQIRAYQVVLLSDDKPKKELNHYYKEFSILKNKCASSIAKLTLLKESENRKNKNSTDKFCTLDKIIDYFELKLTLSEDIYFLMLTYILSENKHSGEYNISYGIDYNKLCSNLNISSKTFAKKVIHHFQRIISKKSCQFIFKLSSELAENLYAQHLLKSLYFKDEIGRHVISCYEVTKVILSHALKSDKRIVVKSIRESAHNRDEVVFMLKASLCKKYYELVFLEELTQDAVLLFIGLTRYSGEMNETKQEFIERFMHVGFENVVLANMAQHPQYSGLLLDDKKYNPYDHLGANGLPASFIDSINNSQGLFLKHKSLSYKIGCCQENSDLFLLTHIHSYHLSCNSLNLLNYKETKWL